MKINTVVEKNKLNKYLVILISNIPGREYVNGRVLIQDWPNISMSELSPCAQHKKLSIQFPIKRRTVLQTSKHIANITIF